MRRTTLGPINGGTLSTLDTSVEDAHNMSFGAPSRRKSLGAKQGTTAQAPSTTKKAPAQSRLSLVPTKDTAADTMR